MEAAEKNLALFEGDRATHYDNFVQQWIPNYNYFMSVLPRLLAAVSPKKMLAVGCGTGAELLALKKADETWAITGVDPSPEMIAIAQKKLASHKKIEFFTGTIDQLQNKGPYGAASLILVLHFIKYPSEKLSLLTEIAKRLQPGAPFITMGIFGNKEQLKGNLDVLKRVLSKNISQEEIGERMERITHSLHRTSEEELQKLLTRAGFEPPTRFFQASIYSAWLTKKTEK
ncbi:MAG: class I SAM-dependent methyltransferase [Bacteroidota bacterium]